MFVQTCQLEAVRQDLMRERVDKLAGLMLDLTEDLAANNVTNQSLTAALVQLRADLLRISTQHVAEAANALRAVASESGGPGGSNGAAKDHAAAATRMIRDGRYDIAVQAASLAIVPWLLQGDRSCDLRGERGAGFPDACGPQRGHATRCR